jgi:hypothetical protein
MIADEIRQWACHPWVRWEVWLKFKDGRKQGMELLLCMNLDCICSLAMAGLPTTVLGASCSRWFYDYCGTSGSEWETFEDVGKLWNSVTNTDSICSVNKNKSTYYFHRHNGSNLRAQDEKGIWYAQSRKNDKPKSRKKQKKNLTPRA